MEEEVDANSKTHGVFTQSKSDFPDCPLLGRADDGKARL